MSAKNIFKIMVMAVICLCAFTFASCGDDDDSTPSNMLGLNVAKVEVNTGETAQVAVSNATEPITAKSGNEKIATATVDKNVITVRGVAEGSTMLIISDNAQRTATLPILVKSPMMAALSFDKSETTMGVGEEATVSILSGTAPYTVKSGDEQIATASVSGLKITIKGIRAGITVLTVTDTNKRTGVVFITVK